MQKKQSELYWKAASTFNRISSFGHFPEPEPPCKVQNNFEKHNVNIQNIKIPSVSFSEDYLSSPLSKILISRQSLRCFGKDFLLLDQLFYLLWAGYGSTNSERKTVPSAGGLYPLKFIVLTPGVEGLENEFYNFEPNKLQLSGFNIFPLPNIQSYFKSTLIDFSTVAAVVFIIGNWKTVCSKYG